MPELTRPKTHWTYVLKHLQRHQLAFIGLTVLGILYFSAIFADFLAPYSEEFQTRAKAYHPPTRIHFFDQEGNLSLRPFIYNYNLSDPIFKIYTPDTSKKYYLYFFVKGERYKLLGLLPMNIHLFGTEEPSRIYLLGSDMYGRDIFSRLLYGGRISLSIGLVGVFIAFSIGTVIGGISGYYGGKIDNILMRLGEIIMSFPGFYLMLALRAVFPITLSSIVMYLIIVIIMSFIGWAGVARVIRGMVLSLREQDFVTAAKALGVNDLKIIVRHIIPNTTSYIIVGATLSIPGYILGESALSFLGLGIQEPQASWGNMLSVAKSLNVLVSYPWILIPGFVIFITVMAFNFLGDGLRDALDPHMRI